MKFVTNLVDWAKQAPRGLVERQCCALRKDYKRARGLRRQRLHREWSALQRANRERVNNLVGEIDGAIAIGSG